MAARKTTTRTLKLLRTVLLVSLVGFVLLVYGLYRFGAAGLPSTTESEGPRAEDSVDRDETVMAGEGFDYVITQGETTLARIRAQRVLSEQDDEITLETIDPIEIYREDGDIYNVSSETGTYNFNTQGTTLTGSVLLKGPRGLELRTEGLSMAHSQNTVTSSSSVEFSMAGEFVGSALRLTALIDRDLFKLTGGVRLASTSADREPVRLRCKRLTLDRREHLLITEGEVVFRRGESFLSADRIVFHLTEDDDRIRYVSGRWGLRGALVRRWGGQLVRTGAVRAEEFSLLLDPDTGDPLEARILGRGRTASLSMTDETGLVRLLQAPTLNARFHDGELNHVDASGYVQIREYLAFAADQILRWACGRRAEVDFDANGEMQHAVLNRRVEFRQGLSVGKGDRVEMSGSPYSLRMTGEPARFIDVQGELTAPEIAQLAEDGDVRATGGVRGRFDPDGASSISIGGARGPIRVESAEATWSRQKPSFKFVDDVRLWQDENLLLAQELETLTDEDLIVGRGGIRTFLTPPPKEDEDGEVSEDQNDAEVQAEGKEVSSGDNATEDDTALDDSPVEITSRWMEYGLETRRITYHDNVVMQQAGRRMTCSRADATMRDGGGIESVYCEGNATVVDGVANRTVRGESALYLVATGEITFSGTPVVLTGDKGERIQGATLVYDLSTGAARVERSTGPPPDDPIADDPDGPDADENGPDSEDDGSDDDGG